jgi:DNA-binding transcriptional LysR family regulator
MDNLISLDDLKNFYLVADLGNLTEVVRTTKTSQQTLTRSIQRLEATFGCTLYTRGRSGIILTPGGVNLYLLLKEKLAPLHRIKETFLENIATHSGNLKIATTYSFGSLWLTRRLNKFYSQHPNIVLDVYAKDEKVDIYSDADASVSFQPYGQKEIVDYGTAPQMLDQ